MSVSANRFPWKVLTVMVAGGIVACLTASAEHPRVLVKPNQRQEIQRKVETYEWAAQAYKVITSRVDGVADRVAEEPDWLVSRLMMNWETHYMLPVTRESRWVGGEGRAPVPTPRFAGARDWKSIHGTPRGIENWKPYNSWGDDIWLWNKEENEGEWVHPSETGRTIESINRHVMTIAAEAAFLHWLTGEERYADVALPVLWTYMDGFQHVLPPRIEDPESGSGKIIGTTSFEVIHEDILTVISQCYDFIQPHLVASGKDPRVVQRGIKRMIDRVVEGGLNEGNWNLFQAKIITHGALALEPDEYYPDGKGREHYLDVVLHADLPGQLGLIEVVESGYDRETALWPEAPGYGFETTASILDVANLIAMEPGGDQLLNNPQLERAMLAQAELVHPNGLSIGIGDTTNVRINMEALEMLIAAARKLGKKEQESRLTALLRKEIVTGRYNRSKQSTLYAITNYVGELLDVEPFAPEPTRTYMATPLNAMVMHLDGKKPEYDLSAVMFGTAGGHAHANGLAIEMFGAGHILAPDPGRGSSYWQRDQRHYYSRMPAHNTVIPNGHALYSPNEPGQLAMEVLAVEPETFEPGLSRRVGFAQAGFRHLRPGAEQRRTFAMIRVSEKEGFYFDVFRSRVLDGSRERHHDFLYHGQAQSAVVMNQAGEELPLEPSQRLGEEHGDLSGYDFFRAERSCKNQNDLRARFELALPDGSTPTMEWWMLGGRDRRIFAMEAPQNRAIRKNLPKGLEKLPMPTVLVRQGGSAWESPFVTVYEPYFKKDKAWIQQVRRAVADAGVSAVVVEGKDSKVLLMDALEPGRSATVEGFAFDGVFGAVFGSEGGIDEVYLGHGRELGVPGLRVKSRDGEPISAALKRRSDGSWVCEGTGPVEWEAEETVKLPELFGSR